MGLSKTSMVTIRNILTLVLFLPVFFLMDAGCLTVFAFSKNHADKPVILCSTTQIADFTKNIVGDSFDVKCVLAPGADPHTYMPTPKDAQIAVHSTICIQNGLNLEGKNWMATLARDAGKPIIKASDGVTPLELESDGKKITDPHAWFSPKNAVIYVSNITSGISRIDPSFKWELEARARLYLAQLRALDAWIRQMVHAIPVAQRILVTSHDAFNYFAHEYGFKNQAPIGWSTGSEIGAGMTPARFKTVVESIRNLGVRSVFVETSVNPKLIREIAREAGVNIGGELYSDSMGAENSAGETYIGMMRENVLTIVNGLK